MPFKIMLDARCLTKQNQHGIARHTYELIQHIIPLSEQNDIEYILLISQDSPLEKINFPSSKINLVRCQKNWLSPWAQIEITQIIKKYQPQLFHSPHFIVPIFNSVPLIVTLHDMNHIALSKSYSLKQKIYYKLAKKRILSAKNIITVSQFSKQEIEKYLNYPSNKIKVIYNGIDNNFIKKQLYSETEKNNFRAKYQLPQKYIFSMGNHKAHKNLERLLIAYDSGNFAESLVVLTDKIETLLQIKSKCKKPEKIQILKGVVEEDLSSMYSLSTCFVYPSLYEGFGLAVLEASACQVPVITSNTTSLPEIMQEGALYFNPEDILSMQSAIHKALQCVNMHDTTRIQYALKNLERFSWQQMAQKSLELYLKFA